MNRRVFLLSAAGTPLLAAPDYGKELPIVAGLGIGFTSDAAVDGNSLFTIGGGKDGSLYAADISTPGKPKVVGKLPGLGHVRQIRVRNGIAYVTSREDGFFLIDVRRRERPVLLSHYDTIELATGLALSGQVAFIACRQCGVELIDISDPKRARHLSTIRVGEAQSVAARDGYLYAGVWGTRELVVCDARDPRHPVRAGRADLDGFGDGVALQGRLCFVATGHHSRNPGSARPQPGQPGYGTGHGLEIFDISRPPEPRFLSRIKTPPRYRIFMDMWGVKVSGRYAFVHDTYNGAFVIDVSDPERPKFAGHRQLPEVPARGEGYIPAEGTVPSPAAGLAVGRGFVYVAGGYSDLHVVAAPGLASPVPLDPDKPAAIPPPAPPARDPRFRAFQPGGQIHDVVPWGKYDGGAARLVLPAGNAGFHLARFERNAVEPVAQYSSEGIVYGAAVAGDTVYIAEGMGGLSIWRGAGKLKMVGRYRVPRQSVKQVVVDPAGRFAMLHVGLNLLEIVDVSKPESPKKVMEDGRLGLFYQRSIMPSPDRLGGVVIWGHDGLFTYDVASAAAPRAASFEYPFGISARCGAARYGEGWLVTYNGKYFLLRPGEKRPPQQLGLIGVKGREVWGKPTLSGNTLFLSDPYGGGVTALDISTVSEPKVIGELELNEHPGFVVEVNGVALIPGGYQGLLVWPYSVSQRASVVASLM
jgi:hypothetical protein